MEDIQTYKDQLALVKLQLEADPGNEDLLSLKSEFEELISLTEMAAAASAPKEKARKQDTAAASSSAGPSSSKDANWQENGQYKAGMDCMAKYKDGKWYPARINQVSGAKDSPLYTITFKGYTGSTNVPLSSLRPHDPNAPIPKPAQPKKTEVTDREREKKKKKGEKWMATQKAQADEARAVQHSWQKFGKKAAKKGIHIAGLEGKSVFRTSDSAYSRVGVVNSGKGMTAYERMGKHKYEKALDE